MLSESASARLPASPRSEKDPISTQSLLERVGDIVYSVAMTEDDLFHGVIEFVGGAVESILGYTPEDFVRSPGLWFSSVHPADLESLMESTRRLVETKRPALRTYRLRRRDSPDFVWIEDKTMPQYDLSGRFVGMCGIARDITERRRSGGVGVVQEAAATMMAEVAIIVSSTSRRASESQAQQTVRRSEDHFRGLAEQAGDITFRYRIQPSYLVEYISPSVEAMTGYRAEEFHTDPDLVWAVIHAEDAGIFTSFAEDPGSFLTPQVARLIRRDGTIVWTEQRMVPVYDELHNLVAIEGIAKDITERKQSEEDRRTLFLAVEQTADSIFITDKDGTIEYVNPAFERFTGYAKDEAIGKNPRILRSGYHSDGFYKRMYRTLLSGKPFEAVFVNRKKSGELYSEEETITPIRDSAGLITHFVSTGRDVTERRKAENLELRLRAAEEGERLKANLLGTVSHELRTPLAAILGYTSAILAYGDRLGPGKVMEYVRSMDQRGRELERLIQDLLLMSQLESGSLSMAFRETDFAELISETVEEAQFRLGLRFETAVADAPLLAWCDPVRIRQVLQNLIENASKHSASSEPISVSARLCPRRQIEVTIRDHGVGVQEEELASMFLRFYKGKAPADTRVSGAGLGLSICKSIVEAHRGTIRATLPAGGGLSVSFTLPRGQARPNRRLSAASA